MHYPVPPIAKLTRNSLIDRTEQFFIGGCSAERIDDSPDDVSIKYNDDWFGCTSVNKAGGLCEVRQSSSVK